MAAPGVVLNSRNGAPHDSLGSVIVHKVLSYKRSKMAEMVDHW
jgi:hypothetical protein